MELIDRGANVRAVAWHWQHETPLHLAVRGNDRGVADKLVRSGAYVTAKDRNGVTPLQLAQELGRTDIADLLRKHGATE